MITKQDLISLNAIVSKEMVRVFRIWAQTLLPSAITMTLYFVIFGSMIGHRVGLMQGVPYVQYIAPGLIMMAVITSAYTNVSSSFYSAKFVGSIQELLVSPTPNSLIVLGYVMGGVVRAVIVGILVTIVSLIFTDFKMHHVVFTLLTLLSAAMLFATAGFVNAVYANSFDDVSIIPTFVLTPLIYLGGVFYSVSMLSPFWHGVSLANPILYIVNMFRFGLLGISDINVYLSLAITIGFVVLLFSLSVYMLKKGIGVRT